MARFDSIYLKLKVEHWFFQEIGVSEEHAPLAASPSCISGFRPGTPEAGLPAGGTCLLQLKSITGGGTACLCSEAT